MKKTISSFVGAFFFTAIIIPDTTAAIFREYCTPGLCKHSGGDGMHTGCRNGKAATGQLTDACKEGTIIDIYNDEKLKKVILDFHNKHRDIVAGGGLRKAGINSACRMGAVIWDEELRYTAELHARECKFAHDKCRGTLNYPFSGQNLGCITYFDKKLNFTEKIQNIMRDFYVEYKDTEQKQIDKFYKLPPGSPMTGHFLTMMNEKNNRVGCTGTNYRLKPGKMQFLLSCNYAATSVSGSAIYNSCKQPGLKCTSGRHPKYPNICSIDEEYNYINHLLWPVPYDETVIPNIAKEESREVDEDEGNDDVDDPIDEEVVDDFNGFIVAPKGGSFSGSISGGSITNDIWHYCLLLSCIVIYFLA